MLGETEILADYVARGKYEDLPEEVVVHVKKIVMDILSCGMGGRKTREGDLLVEMVREMGGKPQATIIGEAEKVSYEQAALAHPLD